MTSCFHCGEDDHLSYDCPSRTRMRPAPPAQPAPNGAAPIPEAGPLSGHCPLCGAIPGKTCYNLVSGQPMYRDGRPVTHPARQEPIWHDPHTAARRAQIASGQIGYTGIPATQVPYLNEPAELASAGVGRLADELRKIRSEDAGIPDRSPEREAAARELAARQVAEARAARRARGWPGK